MWLRNPIAVVAAALSVSIGAGCGPQRSTDGTASDSATRETPGETATAPEQADPDSVVTSVGSVPAIPPPPGVGRVTARDHGDVDVPPAALSRDDGSGDRIVPLDGDLAEIVFALGRGGSVVATDISATYPPAADAMPEIGYQRALVPEPIVEFAPTIVLATDLAGPPETLEALERLGIPVEIMPSEDSPNGPGDKIRAVAAAIGVPDEGDELAALVDGQIRDAMDRAAATTAAPRVGVLYLRGENVQLLLGEGSGVDWLLEI